MQAPLVFPVPLPVPPVEEVNSLTGLGSVRELKRNNIYSGGAKIITKSYTESSEHNNSTAERHQ